MISPTDRHIFDELLDAALPAALTTLDADGLPRSLLVWCAREGISVSLNAGDGVWLRNVRRDPRLSLVVHDPENILRYVALRGQVAEVVLDENYQNIDELSLRYEGRPFHYARPEDGPRFRVLVEPRGVRIHDGPPPPRP